ncbi:triacylglycerol lipase 2 [Quercus suber]|uniref:Triacylglycerol lipase 2 n=1 Tax=Quercus suber TaxID=58331 RepID=A0AAW0J9K4_QUESU
MDYTSNTLLLAVLLFASAVAVNSQDSLCKSMVETNGYVCEEHKVTTQDGYILGVQRIPVGMTNTTANRPPVLLQHGIFMIMDLMCGLEIIEAQNLAAYWEWTWAQLANDDLPAMYDYIHNQTRQKLYYVGHSLGTLLALASFSQEKLVNLTKSAALLCPIAYTSQTTSVFPRTIAKVYLAEVRQIMKLSSVGKLLEGICHLPLIDCSNLVSAIAGPNCCIKPPTYDVVLNHTPQSTSTKNMVHLAQMLRAGNVAEYDYDDEGENKKHYGQPTPPLYNLTSIPKDIPLFIGYGGKDSLSDVNDVKLLLDDLKDHQKDKLVLLYRDDYAHLDFIVAENAKNVVYDPLIAFLRTQA